MILPANYSEWDIHVTLDEGAKLPVRGTDGSAGLDMFVLSREWDPVDKVWKYNTGVHVEVPRGYLCLVCPRSSIAHTVLSLTNSVGIIDPDYRGPIMAKFSMRETKGKIYEVGERCCQLVIIPDVRVNLVIVDKLSETERGAGGYGSTGK